MSAATHTDIMELRRLVAILVRDLAALRGDLDRLRTSLVMPGPAVGEKSKIMPPGPA